MEISGVTAICGLLFSIIVFRSLLASDELGHIPGPLIAPYTSLYKVWLVFDGRGPQNIRRLHDHYGPYVRVGPRDVYIADAGLIPTVFAGQLAKSRFYETFDISWRGKLIQVHLSARDPATHQPMRNSLAPKLSITAVRDLTPRIRDCVEKLMQKIAERAEKPIDIDKWLQHWSYDSSMACTFGSTFELLEHDNDQDHLFDDIDGGFKYATFIGQVPGLHRASLLLASIVLIPFKGVWQRPNLPGKLLQALEQKFHEQKDRTEDIRQTHLGRILANKPQSQVVYFDDIVAELFTLVANNATANASLLAVLYYLAHSPEDQAALYTEIQKHKEATSCEVRDFDTRDFGKLHYLNAVLKESFRMCPAAALPIERVSPRGGINAGSLAIPGDVNVSICPNIVHRDADVFGPGVNNFNPGRWLVKDAETQKAMHRSLISFGHGQRACAGKHLAETEMFIFLTSCIDRFEVGYTAAQPEWNLYYFWVPQAPGTKLIFRKR